MNRTALSLLSASALLSTLAGANAQTVARETIVTGGGVAATETTTTRTEGFISEVRPDVVAVRVEGASAPVVYSSTTSTVYVDEAGQPVSREIVTSGLPVTVQYTRLDGRLVADRVVVHRRETVAPAVTERQTTVRREAPAVVEKKVHVERPVVVEKTVEVPPVVEKKTTTTTTTTSQKKKEKNDD